MIGNKIHSQIRKKDLVFYVLNSHVYGSLLFSVASSINMISIQFQSPHEISVKTESYSQSTYDLITKGV